MVSARCARRAAASPTHSSAPWNASRFTSVTTRRCDSIANDEQQQQRRERIEDLQVERQLAHGQAPQQQVDEQAEHGEQERGREELRRAEHAQLGRHRLDQREPGAGGRELEPPGSATTASSAAGVWPRAVATPHGTNSAKPMQA